MGGESGAHQADAARRARLRWRARRGLLENDLLMQRFFERHEASLGDDDVAGLDEVLDLPDNELLDFVLGRRDPGPAALSANALRVLRMLREL